MKRLLGKILSKIGGLDLEITAEKALPKQTTYCSKPGANKFIKCTKEYLNKLFRVANYKKLPNIMVDQIVPSSNLAMFARYLKDIKIFVVDRNLRDIYISISMKSKVKV